MEGGKKKLLIFLPKLWSNSKHFEILVLKFSRFHLLLFRCIEKSIQNDKTQVVFFTHCLSLETHFVKRNKKFLKISATAIIYLQTETTDSTTSNVNKQVQKPPLYSQCRAIALKSIFSTTVVQTEPKPVGVVEKVWEENLKKGRKEGQHQGQSFLAVVYGTHTWGQTWECISLERNTKTTWSLVFFGESKD